MRTHKWIAAGGLITAALTVAACGGGSSSGAASSGASQSAIASPVAASASSAAPSLVPSSGTPSGSASTIASAPGTSASTAGSSAPVTGSTALDVCAAVPPATAAQLLGKPVTSAKNSVFAPGAYQCAYATDVLPINVIVFEQSSDIGLSALKVGLDGSASKDSPVVAVSGVGDQAYVGADGLIASFGNRTLQIEGSTDDVLGQHAGTIALAKAVIAALK